MDLSRRAILTRLVGGVVLLGGGVAVWQRRELAARLTNLRAIVSQSEYLDGLETPEDLLAYIKEHRADVALVSYTAASDGSIDPSETDLSLGANEAMPLASTIKIVVLAAYARAVVADRLDPDAPVSIADWERYYVPGTDGGAHAEALTVLGITADDNGWAVQQAQSVPLHETVRAMIRFSDNAATDYLRTRLGAPALDAVIEDGNLRRQEPIHSFVGEVLLWANHDAPRLTDTRLNELLALSRKEYLAEVASYENRYLDTEWGTEERRWRNEHAPTPNLSNQRIASNELSAKGTADEYARMMAGVVTESFLSPAVSEIMREYLEWPMDLEGNREQFRAFGAKGGSLAGVLTEAAYLVPKTGPFAGTPRVVALFMREMPLSAWLQLQQTFGQQAFYVELATNEEFATRVSDSLKT